MTQIIMLALDGEAIPLKGLTVTPTMQFQEKDQSGQTSSTATAEQGIKAKELRVSGLVPFSTPQVLTRLFALAEAKDAGGALKKYRVANQVAQAINFRQGSFSGAIDAPKQDGKMAWLVTFTLKEFLSVSEKREARASGKTTAKKQTAGGAANGTDASEDQEKLTLFERKVLKPLNEMLGPPS